MFLDIVDLDENPDNSLVLAKLSEEVVKSAGKKGGGLDNVFTSSGWTAPVLTVLLCSAC